jgi:hypothetical protein
MRAGPNIFFWASKKLVTGPNGIIVAQTFCDILFMVILVGTGVQLKLRKHPNAYIAIK